MEGWIARLSPRTRVRLGWSLIGAGVVSCLVWAVLELPVVAALPQVLLPPFGGALLGAEWRRRRATAAAAEQPAGGDDVRPS